MPPRHPPIQYLNTDLDLRSKQDLRPLVRALERADMYALHVARDKVNSWSAHLETNRMARKPNAHMTVILKAIENLKPKLRAIWDQCKVREFNVGYDSGFAPPHKQAFNNLIPNQTLYRMAMLGASIRITIYPPDEEGPPPIRRS